MEPDPAITQIGCSIQSTLGSEIYDVVFVIDGSGSLDSLFNLQVAGIYEAVCGEDAFIPIDGSTAIGIIEFAQNYDVEMPLTVVDATTIADICACIAGSIEAQDGATYASLGLSEARRMLDEEAAGSHRFVVFSSDGAVHDESASLSACESLRTSDPPVTICSIIIPDSWESCTSFPHEPMTTAEQFMSACANSQAQEPDQPIGGFGCAEAAQEYTELAAQCLCPMLHEGEADCNENGLPDVCEIGNDCNSNSIPDDCDVDPSDPDGDEEVSDDCNANGIPDECESDCNENGVADECDLRDGTSSDWNYNDTPDECDWNTATGGCGGPIYVDQNPAIAGTRDGTSWATAFATVQQALTEASARLGQSCEGYIFIHAADGTYRPDEAPKTAGNRSAAYQLLSGVAVVGGFAGYGVADPNERRPQVYRTVLSGDLQGNDVTTEFPNGSSYADNSYHVLVGSEADSTAVLDGVFIVSGNANYENSYGTAKGGGVYMGQVIGSPRLVNCVIANNWANREGATGC